MNEKGCEVRHSAIWCQLSGTVWPKKIAISALLVMVMLQIYLIITYWNAPQLSDYESYISLAQACYGNGSWYPMPEHIYSNFIFAPGLINYFVLQLKLFDTLNFNMILNLLLNLGVIAMMFSFARRYFSESTAWWSVAIYSLFYSTWWIVVPMGTEVPFLALSMLGLWMLLRGRPAYAIVAGICFALANWIRPLVIIFIAFGLLALWFDNRKDIRKVMVNCVSMVIGYGMAIGMIGWSSYSICGEWITKSSTGGINLAYTANDKAYGGVAASLYNDSTNLCFIEGRDELIYSKKDSIWRARAIDWIKNNPDRYAKLYIMKWGGIFVEDAWPDRCVLEGAGMVDSFVHGHISFAQFLPHALRLVAKSLLYYIVLAMFALSLYTCRRSIFTRKGVWLLLWLVGIAATCIFAVTPRYHYPFLFVMVMWSAYGLTQYFEHRCHENKVDL